MSFWNNVVRLNNFQSPNFVGTNLNANPGITDVSKVLNLLNNGFPSCGSELNTDCSAQQNMEKTVYDRADMGEANRESDKDSYIKAVFHITKVDRRTNKEKRINKHRHVISL